MNATYKTTKGSITSPINRFGTLFMILLTLAGCGGGGGGGTNSGGSTPTPPPVVVQPVVLTVSGTILDEEQAPIEGASVSIDGIEALNLTDAQGNFAVQSENAFSDSATVTVTKDGYEPFDALITLSNGSANNTFQLDSTVEMVAIDSWGYLEINVTPARTSTTSALFDPITSAASSACDCEVNIAGRVYKKGQKKSKLYILLIVDASGSTNDNSIGDKRVFDVEIEALSALIDNLTVREETHVGVIKFASQAEIVADFTTDLAFVKTALGSITPETSGTSGAATNYQAALELAKDTFAALNPKKRDIKTVAFLSDGIPTAPFGSGNTQEPEDRIVAIEAANSLADDGVSVNTFPVNIQSNLTTLPSISAITQGNYFQHDSTEVIEKLPDDSLVGILGIEMVNETTSEQALSMVLRPDGQFSGNICLTSDETNEIKISPFACENCDKPAYQKLRVNCTVEECSSCAGQVTNLELQYTGTLADANIRVTQRKNANKVYTLFDDVVQPDGGFEFSGAKRDKTMGSSIQVYVNDELNAEFVTSCGQPKIGPGRINGDFIVTKGYSRNGGLLCPIE